MSKDYKKDIHVLPPKKREYGERDVSSPNAERRENSAALEAGLGSQVAMDGAAILDAAADDAEGEEDPYGTGQVVGRWHGALRDAELLTGDAIEAGEPLSEPLSAAGALALARASGGAAVVLQAGEQHVVHVLNTTALLKDFSSSNVVPATFTTALTAVPEVFAFITTDGVVVQPMSGDTSTTDREEGETSLFLENASPAKDQASPVSGLTEAFGEGLSDFTNAEGEVPEEDREALLRAFQVGLQDVARDRLRASKAEAETIAGGGQAEETQAVAGVLEPSLRKLEALHQKASYSRVEAFPMQGAGHADRRMSQREMSKRVAAHDSLEQKKKKIAAQEQVVAAVVSQAPVLAGLDANTVSSIASGDHGAVKDRALEVLNAITNAANYISDNPGQLWAEPRLVSWTMTSLGLTDEGAGKVIREHADKVVADEKYWQVVRTAIGIGLAVTALALTGGAALAVEGSALAGGLAGASAGLAGVSAGVGVWDFAAESSIYNRKSSLADTDFNAEESLVDPAEAEGQLAWLALSLVGIGLDAADAIELVRLFKAGKFRSNKEVVQELKRLGATAEAAEELAQQIGATGDLGRWRSVLGGVSDPGAAKALDEAWAAAGVHDIKSMEAAFARVEDGLEPGIRDAAWEELTHRLWEASLNPVRMAGETHNLRVGYEGGQYVLLLCSDCAALGKTLKWLSEKEGIKGTETGKLVQDLQDKVGDKLEELNRGAVPDTNEIRKRLEDIGRKEGIGCLSCLADAGPAGMMPGFEATLDMVGKPLREVQGTEAFQNSYQVYERDGVLRIRRTEGNKQTMPELVIDEDGLVNWRPNQSARPSEKIEVVNDLAKLEQNLVKASKSVERFLQTARNLGVSEDAIQAALKKAADTVGEGTHPVDRIRSIVKQDLRPKMLTRIVGEEGDKAGSVQRINEVCASLNPGDQGQLAEEWLIAHRVKHQGDSADNYLTQVFMTQEENPAMSANRKPDLGIRENEFGDFEINEVKSGTAELSEKHDIPQIEDMLKATEDGGGTVRKGEKSYEVNDVVLTFTNIEKPMQPGTTKKLAEWVKEYNFFSVEVFDANGKSAKISKASLSTHMSKAGAGDLAGVLMALKAGTYVL